MVETRTAVLVVGAGPALRQRMADLSRQFGYRVDHAADPFEANEHLQKHVVHAIVCEAAPSYTAECKFVREVAERSARHPVIIYTEPVEEEALISGLGSGTFYVVRPRASVEELHRTLREAINRARFKAASDRQVRHEEPHDVTHDDAHDKVA